MAIKGTKVQILDNSGATVVRCLRVQRSSTNRPRKIGDVFRRSVYKYIPNKKVRRKGLYSVLVVSTRRKYLRRDGSSVRFDHTRGVLVSKTLEPLGTRLNTPIAKELKRQGSVKLISLSRGSC